MQGGRAPSKSKMAQQLSPCQFSMPTLRLEGHRQGSGLLPVHRCAADSVVSKMGEDGDFLSLLTTSRGSAGTSGGHQPSRQKGMTAEWERWAGPTSVTCHSEDTWTHPAPSRFLRHRFFTLGHLEAVNLANAV